MLTGRANPQIQAWDCRLVGSATSASHGAKLSLNLSGNCPSLAGDPGAESWWLDLPSPPPLPHRLWVMKFCIIKFHPQEPVHSQPELYPLTSQAFVSCALFTMAGAPRAPNSCCGWDAGLLWGRDGCPGPVSEPTQL